MTEHLPEFEKVCGWNIVLKSVICVQQIWTCFSCSCCSVTSSLDFSVLYKMLSHCPFVSRTRCYACILYVEDSCPRGLRGWGATVSCRWWLFCLECHPQRRGKRGQDGVSQESQPSCPTQSVIVWWSWAEWAVILMKNKASLFILCPSVTVWISHRLLVGIQAMMASGAVTVWQSQWQSICPCRIESIGQRGRRDCLYRCEMTDDFQAHYVETAGLKSSVHVWWQ